MTLFRVAVVVLVLVGLSASEVATKWKKEDYPNPVVDPDTCRRPGIPNPRVCDPNSLIEKKHLKKLDEKIADISDATSCQCGPVVCSADNSGFSVSIALLEQMKRKDRSEDDNNVKLQEARVFTEYLGRHSWNFSRCEDDVVIMYSKMDNVLYIATGKKTQKILTDEIVNNMVLIHHRQFPDNIYVGLEGILDKIERTFKRTWPVQLPQRQLPEPPEDDGSRTGGATSITWTKYATLLSVLVTKSLL